MGEPLSGSPQRVRVRNGQMFSFCDCRISGPDQQVAVARECLRTVGQAAVLQHGTRVVDGHVRRIGQRYFVPVDLDDTAHPEYLVGRVLGRVQFEKPVQVVRNPNFVSLVFGSAPATGAVRLQRSQFRPNLWVVVLLIQTPDHRDRLVTRMGDREIFDFDLYNTLIRL